MLAYPDWKNSGFGIYLHWPYCESKCPYCDFNSYVEKNVNWYEWELSFLSQLGFYYQETGDRRVNSIFFGGGTPSLMNPKLVSNIINHISNLWGFEDTVEITLEANPSSVESRRFAEFKAANLLFERGVDVILSDDGLQHFALKRDLELVVVSSDRAFGNRRLLPAGPLREGLDRLDTIDLICLNGKKIDEDLHLENTIGFEIENKIAKNIHNGQIRSIDAFINHDVNLVAGISDPNVLIHKLIKLGININHIKVADHAAIDSSEIKNLQGTSLFLTPKDLVKYSKDDLPKETWELIPEMMIDQSQEQSMMNKIFEIIQ